MGMQHIGKQMCLAGYVLLTDWAHPRLVTRIGSCDEATWYDCSEQADTDMPTHQCLLVILASDHYP